MTEQWTAAERTEMIGQDFLKEVEDAILVAERAAKAEAWRKWEKWLGHTQHCNCERFSGADTDDPVSCNCGLDKERERMDPTPAPGATDG